MPYEFDRYINGVLMAEGVTIERQDNLPDAMREAARIASRGPNGEAPVLVLRAEALSRTGAVKVDRQRLNAEISKWATDSDLHITIGDVEALHEAILSALEPAAPEGQQEAAEADRIRREMEEILRRQSERDIPFAPATRPAEQAVTEAAQFDRADWYWRVMDPDDSGDTPEQAIHGSMLGDLVVCEIASSFTGPTRFGFTAPVLDDDSDDTEFLHFATAQEAIEAAKERSAALKAAMEVGR